MKMKKDSAAFCGLRPPIMRQPDLLGHIETLGLV